MDKYVNFNSSASLNNSSNDGMFSRVMSAGGNVNTKMLFILGMIVVGIFVGLYYYYFHVKSSTSGQTYYPNREIDPNGEGSVNNTAELMFFYADWCPHCKAAKPIWNDLKSEHENKTINGYKIMFTDVDCSEESDEVSKLMNQYSIEGYPTIKLLKDGQVIEYDAKPSKETLTKFLNTVL
jgi:thiol-disulfide isomerase/thioredoxin